MLRPGVVPGGCQVAQGLLEVVGLAAWIWKEELTVSIGFFDDSF